MITTKFFACQGLFVQEQFFPSTLCESFRRQIRVGKMGDTGTVLTKDGTFEVNSTIRQVQSPTVSESAVSLVREHLQSLIPSLEQHFHVSLKEFQTPQFLMYQKGDFYAPHQDSTTKKDAPPLIKNRKITVVIYLNGEGEPYEEDTYGGGTLTIYGLLPDPRVKKFGFPLSGEEGLIVAFPSHLQHEVTPISHGERFSIVSWFC